jgi:hypothetical protein
LAARAGTAIEEEGLEALGLEEARGDQAARPGADDSNAAVAIRHASLVNPLRENDMGGLRDRSCTHDGAFDSTRKVIV